MSENAVREIPLRAEVACLEKVADELKAIVTSVYERLTDQLESGPLPANKTEALRQAVGASLTQKLYRIRTDYEIETERLRQLLKDLDA